MDDQLCSHCGENGLEVDRHCDEMLQCCRVCGIAQAMPDKNLVKEDLSQHFFQQRTNHSPKRKVLVLPNQRNGFIEKEASKRREETRRCLRTFLSMMSQRSTGSLASEAHYHLQSMSLKTKYSSESVAAACILVAARTHEHNVAVDDMANKFGADVYETGRVVRHLRNDVMHEVRPMERDDTGAVVEETLRAAEFLDRDGSPIHDEAAFHAEVRALVDVLRKTPRSDLLLSRDLVVAAAFMLYKSKAVDRRRKMNLEEFYSETGLRVLPEAKSGLQRTLLSVNRRLRLLAFKLPHVKKERVGQLKQVMLVNFVGDILDNKNVLLLEEAHEHNFASTKQKSSDSTETKSKDDDVDQYIRSPAEVEALRPLYEKFFAENTRKKSNSAQKKSTSG